MKNLIKYTIGLPILLFMTLSIGIFGIFMNLMEILGFFMSFIIEGDFIFDLWKWWNDVIEIWQPIRR